MTHISSPPNGRVFCCDCKHYTHGYSDRDYEHCAKATVVKHDTYFAPNSYEEVASPSDMNAHNNCRLWEPWDKPGKRIA